jgi:GT2 family glycosyltransferase
MPNQLIQPTTAATDAATGGDLPLSRRLRKFVRRLVGPRVAWWICNAQYGIGKLRRRFTGPFIGHLDHYRPRRLRIPGWYQCPPPADAPTISIVTPSYNQGPFLERTILSVLTQNYPALEFIIQDGGSTDQTLSILERYRRRVHHVESRPDRGQAHAINLGLQHAGGDILAYLNSDDLLLPGTLNYVARFFHEHPEVDVVYGHRVIINEHDQEVGRWVLPLHQDAAFIWNDYIPQETLFWRRTLWERTGGRIAEEYRFAMDLELLWRFRAAGARFCRLPRFLGAFRTHLQQKSLAQWHTVGVPEITRLQQQYHGRRVSAFEARLRTWPYLCKHVLCHRLYQLGVFKY